MKRPVKLAVGQRWVYVVDGDEKPDSWDDVVVSLHPLRTESPGGAALTWTRVEFHKYHKRIRGTPSARAAIKPAVDDDVNAKLDRILALLEAKGKRR